MFSCVSRLSDCFACSKIKKLKFYCRTADNAVLQEGQSMEYLVFFCVMALFVLFVFIKGTVDAQNEKKKFIRSLYEKYGELPPKEYEPGKFERISRFYKRHEAQGQLDDITWNDLNMDEVYKRVNYTYTSAGEEYLYYTLRTPEFDEEALARKEELIRYFSEHADERVQLQLALSQMGYSGKYSIYDYLDNLNLLGNRSNFKHYAADGLLLLALLFCIVNPSVGLMCVVLLIVYNFISYFKEKNEIDPYIISFSYVMRLLRCVQKVCQMKNSAFEKETEELERSRRGLAKFCRGSFWLMSAGRMSGSGNPLDILLDYLRMMLHLDLMKFNSMLSEVRSHLEDVDTMLQITGYLETTIAIGAYRASLELWSEPTTGTSLCVKQLYHPLLEDAVRNDIMTERGVLLTGSNASGKSTFLKSVALNAVFAQTLHTCTAKEYSAPFYHIYSSMALKDDLENGESYYIVEIKSIKRILDKSREVNGKVLCFVDEVLRGTNTVERIAASTQILRCLATEGTVCFAATHDIELAELLKESYDNYHFEEEIVGEDVHFSYQIKTGKATTRNAIKLLSVMGYDAFLIQEAEEMSERFLESGIWKVKA